MIHKLALFTYLNSCIQVCNVQGRGEAIEALQMKSIIDTVGVILVCRNTGKR